MQLIHATVINFHALDKADVRIDHQTTLIAGRNNSGKTSFVNLFEKFFGDDDTRFALEDFSTCRIPDIEQALQIFGEAQRHAAEGDQETRKGLLAKAYELVPSIRLGLTIEYAEDDDLAPLTDVILDLDDSCLTVKIEAALEAARPQDLLKDFWTASQRPKFEPIKWLRKNFTDYFASVFRAVSVFRVATGRVTVRRGTEVHNGQGFRAVEGGVRRLNSATQEPCWFLSCRTRPASCFGRVGHHAHRHP